MTDKKQTPFDRLYELIPDVDAYLSRIGFKGELSSTVECLKKLMRCHLATVPFENLDVFYGHCEPSLETEEMFRKIVEEHRGGYCFELNGLFSKLLETIGFSVSCSKARILFGRDFIPPEAHRVIIAEICGKHYFCDVGFGGPVPIEPIEIVYDTEIPSALSRKYKFRKSDKGTTLLIEKEGDFVPVIMFENSCCDEADFIPLNAFCAYSLYEPFRKKIMVWLLHSEGRRSIDGNVLTISRNGVDTKTQLDTREDILKALEEWFGISYKGEFRS